MNTGIDVNHTYDMTLLESDEDLGVQRSVFLDGGDDGGFDSAGTFGTWGSAGGCIGSVGTFGCCC